MNNDAIYQSIFWVLDSAGQPHGAGFTLTQKDDSYIGVTCAHILSDIEISQGDTVTLLFDPMGEAIEVIANVPEENIFHQDDVAFLSLSDSSFITNALKLWIPAQPYRQVSLDDFGEESQKKIAIDLGTRLIFSTSPEISQYSLVNVTQAHQVFTLPGIPANNDQEGYSVGMIWGQVLVKTNPVLAISAETLHKLNPKLVCDYEAELNEIKARKLFFEARDAEAEDNCQQAIFLCRQAQQLTSSESLRSQIDKFQEYLEPKLRLESLIDKAKSAERYGDLDQALFLWSEVIQIAQAIKHEEKKENYLSIALSRRKALNELLALVEKATFLEDDDKLEEAAELWERVIRFFSFYQPAMQRLDKIKTRIKQKESLLKSAEIAGQAGDWEKVETLSSEFRNQYPNSLHELKAIEKNQERRRKYKKLVEQAELAEERNNLDIALQLWMDVLKNTPGDMRAKQRIERLQARSQINNELIHKARKAESQESYLEAVQAWAKVVALQPNNIEAENRLENAKHQLESLPSQQQNIEQLHAREDFKTLLEIERKRRQIYASLAYPKLTSKRFVSAFLVLLHPAYFLPLIDRKISRRLRQLDKKEDEYRTNVYPTDLEPELAVTVSIECPGFKTSRPVTVTVSDRLKEIKLLVKPDDDVEVGKHIAKLTILDKETDVELFAVFFEVQVVDFVFDHISRPLVLKFATAISSFSAIVMFVLSFFGQIDTTFGLASGTAIGAVGFTAYAQFNNMFRRQHSFPKSP